MNEKFFDLKKEKQDRMINASLKIFAEHGYKVASTDDIVKEAGISKGLLFHYFISKQGLYEFLFDYCVRYLTLEASSLVSSKEKDYFVLYKQYITVQAKLMKTYPYLFLFLLSASHEKQQELSIELLEKISAYQEFNINLFQKVKWSANQEKEFEKLMNVTDFTIQGLMNRDALAGTLDAEHFASEAAEYLNYLQLIMK